VLSENSLSRAHSWQRNAVSFEMSLAKNLSELLDLQQIRPDAYPAPTAMTGWGRIYGGQAIAQALRAAAATVNPEHLPHSLHAYYLRQGDETQPVVYEVQRLRDGGSFSSRQVVASQPSGAILNCIASFHKPENSIDVSAQDIPDYVTAFDQLTDDETPLFFQSRAVRNENDMADHAWMKTIESFGDDPVMNACAMAYLSDEHLLGSALSDHELIGDWDKFMTASLDHALWFHRPFRVDQWHCFVLNGHGLSDARGLSTAQIFSADGRLVATAAQEALGRPRRL